MNAYKSMLLHHLCPTICFFLLIVVYLPTPLTSGRLLVTLTVTNVRPSFFIVPDEHQHLLSPGLLAALHCLVVVCLQHTFVLMILNMFLNLLAFLLFACHLNCMLFTYYFVEVRWALWATILWHESLKHQSTFKYLESAAITSLIKNVTLYLILLQLWWFVQVALPYPAVQNLPMCSRMR